MTVKADLHVHTIYSADSLITPKDLVFYAKRRGLTAVAITDHDTIEGSLRIARETKDFLVIPGIEVSSQHGHIVGLNVHSVVPKRLSAEETIDRIHAQGGIAIACHPFAFFKGSLGKNVSAKFDAIESINARAFPFHHSNRKAEEAAEKLGLSQVAGTDAHYGPQIGCGYTVIDAEPNVESIAEAIRAGRCKPFGEQVPVLVNLEMTIQRLKRMVKKGAGHGLL